MINERKAILRRIEGLKDLLNDLGDYRKLSRTNKRIYSHTMQLITECEIQLIELDELPAKSTYYGCIK